MSTPPIHGGQGRSDDDVRDSARALLWIALAGCLLFWALVLRWWLA